MYEIFDPTDFKTLILSLPSKNFEVSLGMSFCIISISFFRSFNALTVGSLISINSTICPSSTLLIFMFCLEGRKEKGPDPIGLTEKL